MNYYPENTLARFTTPLHNAVALQGDWEVGLAEIIFPKTWMNVNYEQFVGIRLENLDPPTEEEARLLLLHTGADDISDVDRSYTVNVRIPQGHYGSIELLVN